MSSDSDSFPSTPPRIQLTQPPQNYGAVEDGQVFRSAFPHPHNISFLRSLHIKTVLCLVDTPLSRECDIFNDEIGAKRLRLDIAPNKNGIVQTTLSSIYDALLVILDRTNYPLHVHCNQGRHRTGCVIACLRRLQGWSSAEAIEEYETYAYPKAREGDKLLIKSFDAESMLEYVKQVHFEQRPSLMQLLRSDLVSVEMLVQILGTTDGVACAQESLKSNASTRADSGIEICPPPSAEPSVLVSVAECGPLSPEDEMIMSA